MAEDVVFLLLFFMLPFIWHYLLKLAGLSLFHLTIPSFTIIAIYVYQYIGLPILYFKLVIGRAAAVSDKWLMMEVFFYTSLTITMMCIGFILARQIFGKLNQKNNTTLLEIRHGGMGLSRINIGLFFLITISTLVLIKYLSKVGVNNIALLIVTGVYESDLSSAALRSNMGNAFSGKYHWYKLFMNDLLVFSLLILFSQYLMKKSFITKFMLVMTFLIATFVMVMSIEKAPMANLIISLFLVYIVIRLNGNIPVKKTLYLFLVILLVLAILYTYFMDSRNLLLAVNSVFSRVFSGQIQSSYLYLDYFQNHHDLLFGRSFPNPRDIFPFEVFKITKEIAAWYKPGMEYQGVVGSMPTIFWGEMYANFGFFGVPMSSFLVGFGLYWLNAILFRFKKTPIHTALYVWVLMHFQTLAQTGLSGFMIDIYMVTIILTFFVLSFYSGRGRISYKY
jgi:oligosaccharide repeat unit polymerase